MKYKRLEGASDESMVWAYDRFTVLLEQHQKRGWALVDGTIMEHDISNDLLLEPFSSKYMVTGRIEHKE